jgi:hypothetical protein
LFPEEDNKCFFNGIGFYFGKFVATILPEMFYPIYLVSTNQRLILRVSALNSTPILAFHQFEYKIENNLIVTFGLVILSDIKSLIVVLHWSVKRNKDNLFSTAFSFKL